MVQRKEPWLSVPVLSPPESETPAPAKPSRPAAARPAPAAWRVFPVPRRKRDVPASKGTAAATPRSRRDIAPVDPAPSAGDPPRSLRMPSIRSPAQKPATPAVAPQPRVIVSKPPVGASTSSSPATAAPPAPAPAAARPGLTITKPTGSPASPAQSSDPPAPAPRSPWARPHEPIAEVRGSSDVLRPPPTSAAKSATSPAPARSLADLPAVSGSDWVQKVAEGARSVDVVVVFHSIAQSGSDAFQFAFHTMMQEVLPRLGRPYVAYRFSLDAEPSFVRDMAECLGLPADSAVTGSGMLWSGPRRRLSLMGDRAFASRVAFSQSLPAVLASQQVRLPSSALPLASAPAAPRPATAERAAPPKPPASVTRRRLTAVTLLLAGVLVAGALLAGTVFDWHREPPLGPAPSSQSAPSTLRPPAQSVPQQPLRPAGSRY